MKKNRTLITGLLLVATVLLLGATFYISSLLSSPNNSPTQIQKTKASAVTYKKEINLADDFGSDTVTPEVTPPATTTTVTAAPSAKPTLLAQAPTLVPTVMVTKAPTAIPTAVSTLIAKAPTDIPEPTSIPATPTLQPLLAYKSTTISPTLIPVKDTGGMAYPTTVATKVPVPTKKATPTGVQNLPETGWIQTSSILFIVATTTILFSLLF